VVFDKVRAPLLAAAAPSSAKRGAMITLTGSGLLGATKVMFGKVQAKTYIVVSDHEIRVVVPKKAKTARIIVIGPGGRGRTNKRFVVQK
jgi:hypothetical protein